LPGFVKI